MGADIENSGENMVHVKLTEMQISERALTNAVIRTLKSKDSVNLVLYGNIAQW